MSAPGHCTIVYLITLINKIPRQIYMKFPFFFPIRDENKNKNKNYKY